MALRGTPPALRASIGPAGCWKGRFGGTALGSTGVYWGAGPRDAFTGEAGQWGTGSDRAAAQRHRAGHGAMGCKEGARSSAPQWRSPPPPPHPPEHHGTKLQLSAHALYTGFIGSRKGQDMGWAAVTEGYPRALGTPPHIPPGPLPATRISRGAGNRLILLYLRVCFYRNTMFMHRLFTVQPSLAYYYGVGTTGGGGKGGSEWFWDDTAAPGAAAQPTLGRGERGGCTEPPLQLNAGCSPSTALPPPGH